MTRLVTRLAASVFVVGVALGVPTEKSVWRGGESIAAIHGVTNAGREGDEPQIKDDRTSLRRDALV